jgi:hypothetical protein
MTLVKLYLRSQVQARAAPRTVAPARARRLTTARRWPSSHTRPIGPPRAARCRAPRSDRRCRSATGRPAAQQLVAGQASAWLGTSLAGGPASSVQYPVRPSCLNTAISISRVSGTLASYRGGAPRHRRSARPSRFFPAQLTCLIHCGASGTSWPSDQLLGRTSSDRMAPLSASTSRTLFGSR